LKNFFKYHFLFIGWSLTIFIQSSFPSVSLPDVEYISVDKVIHMGVFGLLTALCYISLVHLRRENIFSDSPLKWSLIFGILYGASDEIHQFYVPNRSAEVHDWAADVLGVIIACLIINYFLRKKYSLFQRRAKNSIKS
jgi:VanZ family protein